MIKVLEQRPDGIAILSMKNDNMEVVVSNYGCTLMKILTKDINGQLDDVILGYETIDDYFNRDAYLGALVGRVANRVGKGTFELNGKTYHLPINNGPNSLHGGIKGFSYQIFDYEIKEDQNTIIFHHISKDQEEGFPGTLDFKAIYTLFDDTLAVRYLGVTDQDTIINITNHSYFNLSGGKELINDHRLKMHADRFACVDADGLPTGIYRDVKGSAFDFREWTRLGDALSTEDEQLTLGHGLDHHFFFTRDYHQVRVYDPHSHRSLMVSTTLPGAQIYTANYLDGRLGKYGQHYEARDAICIETQNLPDSIHLEEKPAVILKKGEVYDEETSYTFEVIKDETSK